MNQLVSAAIVLRRINYGEADRIITVLTPDQGKLSLVARGVRRPKSKLAGGIELFSVSSITYLRGRSDLGRLISARLEQHYGHIVTRLERVQLGYELTKQLDRATEDEPEPQYFELLQGAFAALDNLIIDVELIRFWFAAQLLAVAGFTPNLRQTHDGQPLDADKHYQFDIDAMMFVETPAGSFSAPHIKLLRLAFAGNSPAVLQQITGFEALLPIVTPIVQTMLVTHIRS